MKLVDAIQEYGSNPISADPLVLIWAAEKMPNIQQAKDELSELNVLRMRLGYMPAIVPFGHPLF